MWIARSNKDKQLEFLGATLETKRRDYMQEVIRLYPEILTSKYIKKQLNNVLTHVKEPLRGYSTLPILGLVARDRSSLEIVITNFIEKLELDSTKPIKVL